MSEVFTENDLKLFSKFKNVTDLTEKFFHDNVDSIKYPDKFEAEIYDNIIVLERFVKSLECINIGGEYYSHDYSICYTNWVLVPCDVAWISCNINNLEIARTINEGVDGTMSPYENDEKISFDFTKETLEGIIYINGVKYRRWKPAKPFLVTLTPEFKASKPCNIWLMGGADIGSPAINESALYLTEGPIPFLVHIYRNYDYTYTTTVYACGKNKEDLRFKSIEANMDHIKYEFVFESNGDI